MKVFLIAVCAMVSLVSCNKKVEKVVEKESPVLVDGFQEYVIPAGSHSATSNNYKQFTGKSLQFECWFDSSCIYTNKYPANVTDINKLYGFSDCATVHHENSARFGWLWNGRDIEIYAYCYSNGTRSNLFLQKLTPGEKIKLSINVIPGYYEFEVNSRKEKISRGCSTNDVDGYQLYPYFGGDETAPHQMKIYIRDLTAENR